MTNMANIKKLVLAVAAAAAFAGTTAAPARANNEPPPPQPSAYTQRVSVSSSEAQANQQSIDQHAISGTGRFVAFSSWATNLVPGDTNATRDVFVRDRSAGTTSRVSVATAGGQANGPNYVPVISGDGRYVAFVSEATNLVTGDTNGMYDVFLHDRSTAQTVRVSLGAGGAQLPMGGRFPSLSSDGRYLAFQAERFTAGRDEDDEERGFGDDIRSDIFVRDMSTGGVTLASAAVNGLPSNGVSARPSISADGRYVTFESDASNLVWTGTTGSNVFRRDLMYASTMLISLGMNGALPNDGSYGPSISDDGNRVAFGSWASNLVASDTNGITDVFVRDVNAGTTTRVTVAAGPTYDDSSGTPPSISGDGTRVLFDGWDGKRNVFVRNLSTSKTTKVSLTAEAGASNGSSYCGALSSNGHHAVFVSSATNLVANDTNAKADAFVRYF